jgi:zinc protease
LSEKVKLPPVPIDQYTLSNGLRVVLSPDDAVPVVSVAVYYNVGSRNEPEGRTGFAHLFEHMMFQGSENVPKAGHFQFISKAGGTMNGTTSSERTNYFETLPANQLPLALWLESDRMRTLAVTQENLDNQRDAVKEEKRLRYDNQPYGQVFDMITSMVFKNPANAHSTIGSMEDLDAADVDYVKEFFRIYYAPNNAVLTITGSFRPDEAKALVEKYFGTIPSQPAPPDLDVTEPIEVAETYKTYQDPLAPLPGFLLGWKIPPRRSREHEALWLAGKILYDGDSSRLYQRLVKSDESISQLFGFTDERRGPSTIYMGALPKPGQDVAQIRDVMMSEIRGLAANGPSEAEMEKLHNQLINDEVRHRQSSLSRAMALCEYALYDGDPALINSEMEKLLGVTAEEIKNAVAQYLDTENRSQLDILPAAG